MVSGFAAAGVCMCALCAFFRCVCAGSGSGSGSGSSSLVMDGALQAAVGHSSPPVPL